MFRNHAFFAVSNKYFDPEKAADDYNLNRTTRHWHTDVGAILVIAPGEGPQQKGEYKIRPYSEPRDLLYQSYMVVDRTPLEALDLH